MDKALHLRDDIETKKKEDCVDVSTQRLENFIKKSKESLITADNKIIGNI